MLQALLRGCRKWPPIPSMLPPLLPLRLACFAVAAAAAPCDLSGDWLALTRVGGGGSIPASDAATVRVSQSQDGRFTVSSPDGGTIATGQVLADRNVELHFAHPVTPSPPPPPPAPCATAAACNASCVKEQGHASTQCPGGPVYYCCGICTETYACPTNTGLSACACNPPPPPPVVTMPGTVQHSCNIVLWDCGEPYSASCEGTSPRATWKKINPDVAVVHVVYFSHFDAGFTKDTSLEVLDQYYSLWFPKAYAVAAALKAKGGEESFHWTTHPWLITQMYANATGNVSQAQLDAMTAAIADGAISWHAGSMNLQAETADPTLSSFGLSLSDRLNAQFNITGKKTGMNQKDVPGATIGMVPLAAKAGVKSLHVGVNDFSTPPAVPETSPEMYEPCHTFRWASGASAGDRATTGSGALGDSELICFWCSGYSQGAKSLLEGFCLS